LSNEPGTGLVWIRSAFASPCDQSWIRVKS
jgi:hypothetical protein